MLAELINYNHAANLKIIEAIGNAGKQIPPAERLFSHILNAQSIWTCRIRGLGTTLDTFQLQDPRDFLSMQQNLTTDLLAIAKEEDLSRVIRYTTSKGIPFVNSVTDILYHIVNHSTYHRGQIAMLLRQNEAQPPVTDYVLFKRDGRL